MKKLSEVLKSKRESRGLLLRELASKINVDTALISKIENDDRRPTKEQLKKLSKALEIEFMTLSTLWYAEKIYEEIKNEKNVDDILKEIKKKVKQY
ncbi:helix-turn-helix transcriptional regulator [Maribacter sp. ANRC-HE7]|uniref:Helix-turn-helix transcriptional regulator n=1 Tax=Maribacter aquimaris TaxID=2737171 RepID=A0ABR7UWF8_9FLAO|nr:helix-turn-helix transcriptional regulator [Maribacter aquimaris]MBD0776849.1 helix-turn-helix transcriptional regulator [Maribacter aquimaris]